MQLGSFRFGRSESKKDISPSAYASDYKDAFTIMQPHNIQQTHQDISLARLSSYRSFFAVVDPDEIYGIYCWNEAVSGALFRLISITEIVMRNRFHHALSAYAYQACSVAGDSESNDWYNHIALSGKSRDKIFKETHDRRQGKWLPKKRPLSANDVVSRMTFGFWPSLLDAKLPWQELIPKIVPGHRHKQMAHWKVQKNQDALYARIDLVNRLRNRIAHFEPVWKQGALREERRPRQNFKPGIAQNAPVTVGQALDRLRLLHDRTWEPLRWLSPSRAKDYENSYVKHHFDWLCSAEGLAAYQAFKPGTSLPASRFKRELNTLMKHRSMVRVTKNNRQSGVFYNILR
ncbi:hypothetical protein BTA35_0215805 [Oceanospirillum linum]|uniref:CAAX protease n=2 Tax=Oceanospirillum linum TaxID=966 RepID=A0A1T1H8B4_OCELI|nr:hypothetical protein BTA35_0215805 [Oceanospirillum linum]